MTRKLMGLIGPIVKGVYGHMECNSECWGNIHMVCVRRQHGG